MILKRTGVAVVIAVFILAAAAALRYAQSIQSVSPDTARRAMQVMIGLILAAYANLMPKDLGRWPASARAAAKSQSVLRVGGWMLTLAGLGYACLWAFAPIAFADVAATAIVAIATIVTIGYGAWALVSCRRGHEPPVDLEGLKRVR